MLVVAVVALAVAGRRALDARLARTLLRLQDTTAQIRVRGAFVLLVGFAALAEQLGLEVILGAFAAGAILTLLDRDEAMTHPEFRAKLEAIGFGVFIPVFFVASGVRFDLDALFASASTLSMVPVFLAALLSSAGCPRCSTAAARRRRRAIAGAAAGDVAAVHRRRHAIGQELGADRRGDLRRRSSPRACCRCSSSRSRRSACSSRPPTNCTIPDRRRWIPVKPRSSSAADDLVALEDPHPAGPLEHRLERARG